MAVRPTFGALLLVLGLALVGCGGGGSGDPGAPGGGGGGNLQTVDLTPDPANSGITSGAGALLVTNTLNVGDDPANVDLRAHLSFLINGIPANATITLATLRCSQQGAGGNPYGEFGTLDVDHIDQGANGLDAADHLVAALTANVGALSANATQESKVLVVTNQVIADRAAFRPNSDFRLQFTVAPSADGNPDMAFFSNAGAGEELTLRVSFTTP